MRQYLTGSVHMIVAMVIWKETRVQRFGNDGTAGHVAHVREI